MLNVATSRGATAGLVRSAAMRADLVDALACTECGGELALGVAEGDGERVHSGWLRCAGCALAVPICAGFPLFGESSEGGDLADIERRVFGDAREYAREIEHRYRSPAPDLEAAAIPFALGAPRLRSALRPGERIADLDGRGGWSSDLLAGLFPQQRIVAFVDARADPLAPAGFRYWLGEGERRPNLDVVFRSAPQCRPWREDRFALVHPSESTEPADRMPSPDDRLLLHPAWQVDLHLAEARRAPATIRLSQPECEVLFWLDRCLTLAEIAQRTARPPAATVEIAAVLAAHGIVAALPLSRSMAALHRFHRTQIVVPAPSRQTVRARWRESCRAFAARPLVVVDADDSVFSYADAADISRRVAAAMRRAGVSVGDVVAVCNSLTAEVAFSLWACAEVGAVFAGLDRTTPAAQTATMIEQLEPRLLLCNAELFAAIGERVPCIVFDAEDVEPPAGATMFADWIAADEDPADTDIAPPCGADDTGYLLQTSGTSGKRKYVELASGSLYRTAMLFVHHFDLRPEDVVVSTGDSHASQGLRTPLVATVAAGASFVALSAAVRRNPMALAEAIHRRRATVLLTVPATLNLLVEHADRLLPGALASLRIAISNSGVLSEKLARAFRARFGVPVLDQYGLTESPFATVLDLAAAERGGTSVGRSVESIVQIVGDDGAVLPPGEVGEIRLYSENGMLGYRGGESGSGVRIENGWCWSADLGVRDRDGFVTLLSRRRDIIKGPSGDIVFPAEVEEAVKERADVADAGACGYRANDGEERIALFVVPRQSSEDPAAFARALRRHVLDRLGTYRVPSRIELVESLPRLHDGTLLRHELASKCR